MIYNYYVEDIFNLSTNSAQKAILESDFILTKRGQNRDAIKFLGEEKFKKIKKIIIDDSLSETDSLFSELLEIKKEIKISIDISLIDRKTIADLFSLIAKISTEAVCSVSVIYTLAKYSSPSGERMINNIVKPVSHFFSGWSTRPGLPIMSIVGLGYERDKAMGAIEYLESSKAYLYLPKSQEERYYNDVVNENESILSIFDTSNQLTYRVESPAEAIYSLDSILSANKHQYKIVLFPFGPKIFYALSLVASIPHPEASVWYVSGENSDNDSSQDRDVSDVLGFHFKIKVNNEVS